ALTELLRELPRFAFHADLARVLGREPAELAARGEFGAILDALLGAGGLDYERQPKALIKFHADGASGRTPLEEHLVEAVHLTRDGRDACRLHFTLSAEHHAAVAAELEAAVARQKRALGVVFEIGLSGQHPSTDTVALDDEGRLLRDGHDRLVLRPGGHGALIENLGQLGADLVFVKNIDNVQPDRAKPEAMRWKQALAGYLLELEQERAQHLESLRDPAPPAHALEAAERFARHRLHADGEGSGREALIARLDRPLRVCGVVANTGEPGGGPFWVRSSAGAVSLQLVESAEVDPRDPAQQAILRSATHFNPVDLVCAVRDAAGRPYDLRRFVDPEAAIVSKKHIAGRDVTVLERPGLWNGAMAGWNTVFVEVPLSTFTPVKTLLDLLRPEHAVS
ncbi:MAG TPA: DUF4301 family protein, partial [Candidatus Polarisedimenticolaceae bacterium]|nr:DUF4301 family protein [Candidatus Polarisedimenticolaceae bacterium]